MHGVGDYRLGRICYGYDRMLRECNTIKTPRRVSCPATGIINVSYAYQIVKLAAAKDSWLIGLHCLRSRRKRQGRKGGRRIMTGARGRVGGGGRRV